MSKIKFNKNFFNIKGIKNLNFMLVFVVLILCILGAVFVYSASMYTAKVQYNDQYYFLTKQIIGIVLGFVFMLIFACIDYHVLQKYKWIILIVSVVLLGLVFIPFLGVENYGAKRWIGLFGITIQPSEIAKFAFVIFTASYLSNNYQKIHKFKTLLPVLAVGIIFCALIILEPNMSITMVVAITMIIMLFVGGMRIKHFVSIGVPAMAIVPALIVLEPYRLKRLMAFINPWENPKGEGYQLIQSLYSLAEGGVFGVGLFNSRQKYMFLPFAESDFIFSIIGEETGFFGCFVVIALFAILFYLGIKIAKNAPDRFGSYLATGIISVIIVQVLINVAVVTGSMPPTGVPLPFMSAGSTALVVFMSAIGVVLNVDRQSRKSKI